jgi:AraC-like DNA-binding protein
VGRAQELLAMGRSVAQAGSEAGFDDPYYFSRVFTQQVGSPPSAWAACHQKQTGPGRRHS